MLHMYVRSSSMSIFFCWEPYNLFQIFFQEVERNLNFCTYARTTYVSRAPISGLTSLAILYIVLLLIPNLCIVLCVLHRWASSFVLEGGHKKNRLGGGGIKKISGGVANFQKSPIFTLKLHDLAISEKEKFAASRRPNFFLGRSDFQKKSQPKIENTARGQKALLEGGGSIWTLGGS